MAGSEQGCAPPTTSLIHIAHLPCAPQFLGQFAPEYWHQHRIWSPIFHGPDSLWALWLWGVCAWALLLLPTSWALVQLGVQAFESLAAASASAA